MKRTKKALAVVLSLSMLASITPQIVLANSNIPDRYEEVSEMQAIVKDAEVHAYVTRNGGTAELTDSNGVETTFTQGIGYREYTATPADGWVWKGWTYEQLYQGEDLGNRTDYGWGKRYSFSNDGSDWNSAYNGTGQTISVNRLLTKGETVGNKIIYNIYANFNPTINATAGTGGTITDNGVTEVNYGDSKQYDITADAGQDIASVSVDGQDISNAVGKDNFSYTFENVREPHTIDVTFTNELYTVTYTDGVEGQEIFKDEVYSDLKIGDVTPKFKGSLERKDYVFTGWNPEVTNKVAGTAVYTATWADDKNNNGTPDDKEEKFTVTYTDGVDNEEIFKRCIYYICNGSKCLSDHSGNGYERFHVQSDAGNVSTALYLFYRSDRIESLCRLLRRIESGSRRIYVCRSIFQCIFHKMYGGFIHEPDRSFYHCIIDRNRVCGIFRIPDRNSGVASAW